jgi:hypothetical protein
MHCQLTFNVTSKRHILGRHHPKTHFLPPKMVLADKKLVQLDQVYSGCNLIAENMPFHQ